MRNNVHEAYRGVRKIASDNLFRVAESCAWLTSATVTIVFHLRRNAECVCTRFPADSMYKGALQNA